MARRQNPSRAAEPVSCARVSRAISARIPTTRSSTGFGMERRKLDPACRRARSLPLRRFVQQRSVKRNSACHSGAGYSKRLHAKKRSENRRRHMQMAAGPWMSIRSRPNLAALVRSAPHSAVCRRAMSPSKTGHAQRGRIGGFSAMSR